MKTSANGRKSESKTKKWHKKHKNIRRTQKVCFIDNKEKTLAFFVLRFNDQQHLYEVFSSSVLLFYTPICLSNIFGIAKKYVKSLGENFDKYHLLGEENELN